MFRDFIDSTFMEWVTTQNTFSGKKETFYYPMFQEGLSGIFRTTGVIDARWRKKGRDSFLINEDD